MADSVKPAIVLVHGIWHSPVPYTKFTTALQSAGYDVYAPYLPSCTGVRPPTAKLPEDTQLVRRLVEMLADQGRTIVMVLHSYGGLVGCNAIEGLDRTARAAAGKKGGVAHIVGIAAHLHPTGCGAATLIHEMGNDDLIPLVFRINDDRSCMPADPRAWLFAELPAAEAEAMLCTLSPASMDCLEGTASYEAWRHVPVTYVHCTQDATLPPHYQLRILEKLEKAGAPAKVVSLDTGHSPYLTKTAEVVKVVRDAADNIV